MFTQFGAIRAALGQNRVRPDRAILVPPKSRTVVAYLTLMILDCLLLSSLSVVVISGTGTVHTIIEPPPQLLPGYAAPGDVLCGESANETCYPPADAHCYETTDANCFALASIQQDGKVFSLTIDLASRTIALTSVSAQNYTMGDLMLAWGTPTGFSQSNRAIDVYWGTRSVHLTTCSFRPESHAELITYYRAPAFAAPWRGFVRVNSKGC